MPTKQLLVLLRTDVLSAWQGFRPLASDPNAPPGAPVSRDHVISHNPESGITFITGGKWTTYREMAEVSCIFFPSNCIDLKKKNKC